MPPTEVRAFRHGTGEVPILRWLDDLAERDPRAYVKCLAVIQRLAAEGHALRRPTADVLRDGVYELRLRRGTVQYRILYFFSGRNVATLSHALTKESRVPDHDIDLAAERRRLVAVDGDRYTAQLELP